MAAVSPIESAIDAGLIYVSDSDPGFSRVATKSGFRYRDTEGKPIRDPAILPTHPLPRDPARLERCLDLPQSQRSSPGHWPRSNAIASSTAITPSTAPSAKIPSTKKLIVFGNSLPRIRHRVMQDLSLHGLPQSKVVAAVVRLMDLAHLRVGNEEYARQNQSFGLTTLRCRHVRINGSRLHFEFKGKSGQFQKIDLHDRSLARVVKRIRDLPGYELYSIPR